MVNWIKQTGLDGKVSWIAGPKLPTPYKATKSAFDPILTSFRRKGQAKNYWVRRSATQHARNAYKHARNDYLIAHGINPPKPRVYSDKTNKK